MLWKAGLRFLHAVWNITFSGAFLASGNSLSSSLTKRWMNCWTIGFSLLTIWNPVMLAPPCMTLSSQNISKTLERDWERIVIVRGHAFLLIVSVTMNAKEKKWKFLSQDPSLAIKKKKPWTHGYMSIISQQNQIATNKQPLIQTNS